MRITVCRKAHFNAAHRLYNPAWDAEKNKATFGKCSNPLYHGHNYDLEVYITGEVDPLTGFVVDTKWLGVLIAEHVETYLDHKNLNEEVSEFKTMNPTAEHIAFVIYNRLRPHVSEAHDLEIKLFETARNFVIYRGE